MRISIVVSLLALVMAGCASKPTTSDNSSTTSQPQTSQSSAKASSGKESAAAESSGVLVGKPAPGSKFSKLKFGMTYRDVVAKIGAPGNQWQRPTGKSAIPFYFGDDRWVLECSYKGEGVLTFNYGGDQVLTGISVNKDE